MTGPIAPFTKGQRVWHVRRGWCTYLLLSWDDTSEVLVDYNGEAVRLTTELLHPAHPDGEEPPPVPAVALAEFAQYGLTMPEGATG